MNLHAQQHARASVIMSASRHMERGRDIDARLIVFILLFPITPPEAFPSYGKVSSNV